VRTTPTFGGLELLGLIEDYRQDMLAADRALDVASYRLEQYLTALLGSRLGAPADVSEPVSVGADAAEPCVGP
jgi:hypothetical protein